MTPTTKTEMLMTTEKELIKQAHILDIQSRPGFLYTASANAKAGDPCLVTQFLYVADDSTVLKGKKEGYAIWDSSWVPDSAFSVPDVVDSKTQMILTKEGNIMKQYQLLDGQNRPLRIYEALSNAVTGSPCLVTEYIYQNGTSTTIKGKKESYSTWDVSWVPDSAFTVTD